MAKLVPKVAYATKTHTLLGLHTQNLVLAQVQGLADGSITPTQFAAATSPAALATEVVAVVRQLEVQHAALKLAIALNTPPPVQVLTYNAPPPPPSNGKGGGLAIGAIIGIVVGVVVAATAAGLVAYYVARRRSAVGISGIPPPEAVRFVVEPANEQSSTAVA